ncbi:MAG: porin [Pseudomonadota bacterium]|nr:porin [Pseudomonadota bacterium]
MRKSLLAVALACAFPAVHAQSFVRLYGIVDVGFERLDVGNLSGTRLQSGISAGSRLGFTGSEDLGKGFRALFTLEQRIEADTGSNTNNNALFWCRANNAPATAPTVCPGVTFITTAPAVQVPVASRPAIVGGSNAVNNALLQAITTVNSVGALFDRQAWGGFVTPVGGFFLGRQYTPAYEILNKYNVMGDQTALQFGQGFTNPAIRANNSLQYRIELSGITASLMYGFGGSEVLRNERATRPQNGDDFMGANLQYNTTNWGVGVGYNRNNIVPFNTGTNPQKRTGLEMFNAGGFVGFGPIKLYAQYVKRENDNPILRPEDVQNIVVSTGGSLAAINAILGGLQISSFDFDTMRGLVGPTDSQAYHGGISWRFGNGTLYGVYNYGKDDGRSPWATADAKAQHYGVAYFYEFSRRTQLYAVAAFMNNSDQSRMSLSSAGYTTGYTTAAGEDASAFQVGIRHSF